MYAHEFECVARLASLNPVILPPLFKIIVEEHFYKAGINRASRAGVIDTFNEFKDEVIVSPIEERTYYFGKKAGRIGEMVSKQSV